MEFLRSNQYETTTSIVVQSNTNTAQFLFDRNTDLDYATLNYNSTTSAVISVVFGSPTILSHILLQSHNLRQFRIYYDSVTANSLANVSANSATSHYFAFASVTVNSIDLQMDNTIAGSVEKSVGEFVLTERLVQFSRNPSAKDFDPVTKMHRVIHNMPDGGKSALIIKPKFKAKLKWEFITDAFKSSLETVYNAVNAVYFVPYPTSTSWDGTAKECIWTNDFDFSYDENSKTQGQGGSIVIEETANS